MRKTQSVSFQEQELDIVKYCAKAKDMTISEFIRTCVRIGIHDERKWKR